MSYGQSDVTYAEAKISFGDSTEVNMSNKQRLVMGCPTQFNYTKFKRNERFKARFCIDENNDYELLGNFDY